MDHLFNHLPNQMVISFEFTDEQLQPVRDEIDKIQSSFDDHRHLDARKDLVGNISNEFSLVDSLKTLDNLIFPIAQEYHETIKTSAFTESKGETVFLPNAWVNFMKKHEFNPPHFHEGLLSFVLWIDIPYSIEDEHSSEISKYSKEPKSGMFDFLYQTITGELANHSIPVDRRFRNKGILFPASLYHAVYPFSTSDAYRISVAGNYL